MRTMTMRHSSLLAWRSPPSWDLTLPLVLPDPAGIAKERYVSDANRLLDSFEPSTPIEHMRHQLARELVDDVARLDEQIKESHRRIRTAVRASKTSLTDLFGVGPVLACSLIGSTGHIGRFANRDSFAAYAGIAPVEHSSGGRIFHRLSLRGHSRLNNAIHMVAICQIRQSHSAGRAYFDRKVGEGKTKLEALNSLKRHVSNGVYRQLVVDAERGPGGQ
jgi:transposase